MFHLKQILVKHMTMKEKKTITKNQATQKILELFKEYQDTTGAIFDDYLLDDAAITELAAADENFEKAIEDLEIESDFKSIVEQLREMDSSDIDTSKILEVLDEDEVRDWVNGDGYLTIKVEGMEDTNKLEEFIRENIYPYNINSLQNIF